MTTPCSSVTPNAAAREVALQSFGSRAVFAVVVTAVFCGLAWADSIGLGGALPAWWLLPVAVVLAVGSVDELIRLFAARNILLPGWLLRPAVVTVVLAPYSWWKSSAIGPIQPRLSDFPPAFSSWPF